jgi:hypothetical protein
MNTAAAAPIATTLPRETRSEPALPALAVELGVVEAVVVVAAEVEVEPPEPAEVEVEVGFTVLLEDELSSLLSSVPKEPPKAAAGSLTVVEPLAAARKLAYELVDEGLTTPTMPPLQWVLKD